MPDVELAVFSARGVSTHRLAPGKTLSVGRGDDVDIRIEDDAVSRRHATFHGGPPVAVEDLGSANGTLVSRAGPKDAAAPTAEQPRVRAQRTELAVGDTVYFGAALVVVRAAKSDEDDGAVVRDPAMKKLYDEAARAAALALPILVTGETGSGKDVLARWVHARSARAKKPFIALNCAAITEALAESELFGHEKGAFTGASSARAGAFESASGGTLFLDEIGELPLTIQAKLLRTVETSEVVRVGSVKPIAVDVRIVSATNRDLERDSAQGRFRRDLYFRLNGITLEVPPLRARTSEIVELAKRFLEAASRKAALPATPSIDDDAVRALESHAWPGNVRELRWVMERALVSACAATGVVRAADLSISKGEPAGPDTLATRERVIEALAKCDGNQTRAAELLGVSRRTLINRMIEYGLPRPRKA
ncbi:MAG TPA: sigma 54-dependent Fis family transcriptional regulator [Labilithrix sp.]